MASIPEFQELLTAREVAARYGLAVKTLSNLRNLGKGPSYIKLGHKKILYRPQDVEFWIKAKGTYINNFFGGDNYEL